MKRRLSHNEIFMLTRLQIARKRAGLSQTQVAVLLNKTQSYVSKIESGRSRVHIATLIDFAQIYDTRLDYFVKGVAHENI